MRAIASVDILVDEPGHSRPLVHAANRSVPMHLCRLFCSPQFAATVAALVLLMDLPILAKDATKTEAESPAHARPGPASVIGLD